MIKKFLIIIVLFAVVLLGLQLFGGRDFTQIDVAWDKYSAHEDLSEFLSDVGIMFRGGTIKEGALPNSLYADRVMYRWKDEFGQVHVTERQPTTGDFEEIRLGDMEFTIKEGMSEEEVNAVLQKKQD